jgi:hypothetical protein
MAVTRKEQQMNPLNTDKLLKASFLAIAALVLAAPAGAAVTKPDLEHQAFGQRGTGVAATTDAVDRAVAIQASKADNDGVTVLRKSGTVIVTGQQEQPAWYTALMARSQAMNEFYGAGGTPSPLHPNDRAVPRPISQEPVLARPSGSNSSEWGNVAIGALGGLGIALFLLGGTLVALHKRRHDDQVALP